jgi:hypothetical protein
MKLEHKKVPYCRVKPLQDYHADIRQADFGNPMIDVGAAFRMRFGFAMACKLVCKITA